MTDQATKSAKREARRQRAEQERENKERRRRQQVLRTRLLFALGVAAVIAIGYILMQREPAGTAGRVWSPEHGHWHDR